MALTEKDFQTFKALKKMKGFVEYLKRRKVEIFSDGTVTKDTIDEANGRVKELSALIFAIEAADELKPPETKEFE